ncbi:MAG TPA: nucleoside-diphosphate sugar epimerase/dehydratase [Burkholderiales bacterium]|nr:nucleoside-diphosphate sugar epimerase/dehydratase [Burkholderiales bacterium]
MPRRANWRNAIAFAHDVVATALAWCLAYLFRLNFELEQPFAAAMVSSLIWVVPLQAPFFLAMGMYRGLWRYASFHDLRRILLATALGAMAIAVVILLFRIPWVPRSVLLLYPILLAAMMGGSRIAYRAWKEGHLSRLASDEGRRVVVLGAGAAAANLLGNLGRSAEWNFVGLLDDDPTKLRREIHGVPVLGSLTELPAIAAEREVELAIIAMPKASHRVRRRALELCSQAGLTAMTVPSYEDLVSGKVTVSQLRRVELDDLLGRDPVTLDSEGLNTWLHGRAVLVTGAGGSIGSELCRQILKYAPARLIALEANELALYNLEQELGNRAGDTELAYAIGDVKNARRLDEVLAQHRPSTIFHAAAYKHVPLMEDENAWEAVQNNALGTWRVADAAVRHRVEKVVIVSTDKAVNPTSVMGASKRLAELVCQALSTERTRFVMVRFGNVLGSTGSVIPKFRKQIAAGGPVTVTHPEIRRYFMSIPEAAQLVLQAGLMGRGGEIFVLDMGDPVKIVDLARDLIRLSGLSEDDVKIAFTGLRPGEKLYEELLADDESTLPTPHPKLRIMKADAPPAIAWVAETVRWLETPGMPTADVVRAGLAVRIPEYQPARNDSPSESQAASASSTPMSATSRLAG